jgi:hypothetical protein
MQSAARCPETYRYGGLTLYIPIAVHKNELVLIDNMDTFSRYFCLAKKQKMTPLATDEIVATPEELELERGEPGFVEEEDHSASSSSDVASPDLDDDDI